MKTRLLLLLLAVPLVAYGASWGIQIKLNSDLRSSLSSGDTEGRDFSAITVDKFCTFVSRSSASSADKASVADLCELDGNLGLMQTGAIAASLIGVTLMLLIALAGRLARRRRTLLFLTFAPLLHITMLTLSLLMILHAGLGMATLYYGESILISRVHFGIIFALGLGALLGVLALVRAQFSVVSKTTTTVLGKRLDRANHRALWAFVDNLSKTMTAAVPTAIVAGLEPNFYVTEAKVICLDGPLTGRTMYISAPLCRLFTGDELKAVLGHELAHYKGRDTRFSQRFYPIYRGATQGLVRIGQTFSSQGRGSAGNLVLMPAFVTLSYFLSSFSEAEREISRDRELAADAEAAKISGAPTIATALVKVHAYSQAWLPIRSQMKTALAERKQLINASALFAQFVATVATPEILASLNEEGPRHPTDTHPPLTERLSALHVTLAEVQAAALQTSPSKPAIDLIENAETLEEELTEVEHVIMVKRGEAQLGKSEPS